MVGEFTSLRGSLHLCAVSLTHIIMYCCIRLCMYVCMAVPGNIGKVVQIMMINLLDQVFLKGFIYLCTEYICGE